MWANHLFNLYLISTTIFDFVGDVLAIAIAFCIFRGYIPFRIPRNKGGDTV